jgi:tetratricopeptide (TPR) repeat protein
MQEEPVSELVIRADAAYRAVVADPGRAGPEAARVLADARRAGDPEALVVALRVQAWSERMRFADTAAKGLLDEAARLARRHGLRRRLGEVLVTRAAVNHELGRVAAAQRDLDRAAEILDGDDAAELELQQAALYQNLGRLSAAAVLYRRILSRSTCPLDVRAKVGNNLALVEAQRGHPDAAFRWLDEADRAAADVGPALIAIVAQSRAWVTVQAGDLGEGLRLFDRAADLYRVAGMPLGEHLTELVDALVDLRLLPEARRAADRAVHEFATMGVRLLEAEALLRTARLALVARDPAAAGQASRAATALFQGQHRTTWAARATVIATDAHLATGALTAQDVAAARRAARTLERHGLASSAVEAYLTAGRAAGAVGGGRVGLDALGRAEALARHRPVLVRLRGRVAAAESARLRGDERAALVQSRAGLADLARHRAALPSMELRALASGHGVELGRIGLDVLLQRGSGARVLDWMELTRAAALLAVEPPQTEGIEDELAALRVIQAELDEVRRDTGGEPAELLGRQAALEHRIRRATWERRTVAEDVDRPMHVPELRERLGGSLLVEYGVSDDRLFAVVLDDHRARLHDLGPLPRVREEADLVRFALSRLTRPGPVATTAAARGSAEAGLKRLHDLIVTPLRAPGDVPVVVVSSGSLYDVPWSALWAGPVSVAPSGTSWARTLRPVTDGRTAVVFVAGPDLPGATEEVTALRALHEQPTVLIPPASTATAVAEALRDADLAHLACHGRLRSDNPTFSALVLSDGSLTLHELDVRGVAPHRLVLASCESATEFAYEGEEVLGFVSALMARGTAGVVASPFVVPDAAAVPLMCLLHEELRRGRTLSEALHLARGNAGPDGHESFVNWCAFTAYGGG